MHVETTDHQTTLFLGPWLAGHGGVAPERSDKARNEHLITPMRCARRRTSLAAFLLPDGFVATMLLVWNMDRASGWAEEEEEEEKESRIKEFPRRTRSPSCLGIGCVAGTVG